MTDTELLPKLTPEQELVLLARTLWREGYDDHLAGHITYKQDDGTLLCNPWLLLWEEIRPEDVIRIDLEGNLLEGRWPVPLGIPLHLALHRVRPDVTVAVHIAWHVAAVGSGRPLPEPARSFFQNHDGNGFAGFWEAMARRELRLDPTLLGPAPMQEDAG